ncbi:MAG: glycosyltransferase [bacterium]
MANILIISYIFPPLNSTGCRRVYTWAKYLKRLGHKVSILTADTPDDERTKNFVVDCSAFQSYRLRYFDPRSLIKRIFKVQGPISNEFGGSHKKRLIELLLDKGLRILNRYLSSRGILFGTTRMPTFSDLWFFQAYKKAKMLIQEHDIKIIITNSPPPVGNLVGLALKKRFKDILWIQDFRDLWTQNPVHSGLFPFTLTEGFLERKCINHSDVIIVVSEILKQWLQEKYPQKTKDIFVIENGYDEELLREIRVDDFPESKKTIIYTGTLYERRSNPKRLFEVIDKNYTYLKDKVEISFYGAYETKVILDKFFDKYPNTKDIIKYKGFLSTKDALSEQKKADVLLFIERDKENDGVLTAKLFEYMALRKPILCLGISPSSYVGGILQKTGLGIFCGDNTRLIEQSINAIIKDEVRISPDDDFISNFSREKQVKRLDELIRYYCESFSYTY